MKSLQRPHSQIMKSLQRPHSQIMKSLQRPHSQIMKSLQRPHSQIMKSLQRPHSQIMKSPQRPHNQIMKSMQRPHSQIMKSLQLFDTMRPERNCRLFADDIFKYIFLGYVCSFVDLHCTVFYVCLFFIRTGYFLCCVKVWRQDTKYVFGEGFIGNNKNSRQEVLFMSVTWWPEVSRWA